MFVTCNTCHRAYNDERCWTICPHGPLEFPLHAYCPRCDTVDVLHGQCRHQKGEETMDSETPQYQESVFHPAIEHVLQYFTYEHLPENLQEISRPFCELAKQLAERSPQNQEATFALRWLLLSKDAAVRAGL